MTGVFYPLPGVISVEMTPAEYDIFCIALTLMSWSAITAEIDDKRLRTLDDMIAKSKQLISKP